MKTKEDIKKEIFNKIIEYYKLEHAVQDYFIPGKSHVNYAGRVFDQQELINLVDASLDFWLTYGPYSKTFENMLSKYLGVQHTLLVNSGSSANLLAFMALTSPLLGKRRVKRGDEILTVAAAFPTTVAPIVQFGAIPVFLDIELPTYNIATRKLNEAVSEKTKAIMIAHTLGNPFDIESVKNVCEKYNLWLIEDNCDSLGSSYQGEFTGTWGDIGTSSFYPPHHITMGEGGAVYTNSSLFKKILLSLRDWGRDCWCESGMDNSCGSRFSKQYGSLPFGYDHKYVYSHFGYNLKPTEMQAAIGCAQLDKLPEFSETRKNNFKLLYEGLKGLGDYFILPQKTTDSEPNWFGFAVTVKDRAGFNRNAIVNFLEGRNIQTRCLFAGNIIRHPCFSMLRNGADYRVAGDLVNTDKVMKDSFWIGLYPGMTEEKINYMVACIHEYVIKQKIGNRSS